MRVVIAEDHVISRVGLAQILRELGHEVVAEATTGPEAVAAVLEHRPAVAILDIRMPPTNTDEGLVAAEEVARLAPSVRVLVLSQHLEPAFALRLLADDRGGVGYLLKERILDVSVLEDALRRLVRDECVIDPEIVARLVNRPRVRNPLAALSDRERQVLGELAQGRSNAAIAKVLFMAERTVEAHTTSIFTKLGLLASPDIHRRVQAVLAYLRAESATPPHGGAE